MTTPFQGATRRNLLLGAGALGLADAARVIFHRGRLLARAADVLADRSKTYGEPGKAMAAIAARWSLTLGHPVTPAEVVLCMIDLKMVRLAHDPSHRDSLVDVIGYATLMPEVQR